MGQQQSRNLSDVRGSDIDPQSMFYSVQTGDVLHLPKYQHQLKHMCNTKDRSQQSLLHCVVYNKRLKSVEALLQSGASVDVFDSQLNTPLMLAAESETQDTLSMIELLVKHGADINACDIDGRTALLKAIMRFHYETADVLLRLGANPDIGDDKDSFPIHFCARFGAADTLKHCITQGASLGKADIQGRTALYYAICNVNEQHCEQIMDVLFENGCDPSQSSPIGTPLQIAIRKLKPNAVRILLNHGACTSGRVYEYSTGLKDTTNYADLALKVLCNELYAQISWSNKKALSENSNITRALKVVDLVLPAYGFPIDGLEALEVLTEFKKEIKNYQSKDNHDCLVILNSVMHKLKFLLPTSSKHKGSSTSLCSSTDKMSLTNICRMQSRRYLMETHGSVLSVDKQDLSRVAKDIILLKDLQM